MCRHIRTRTAAIVLAICCALPGPAFAQKAGSGGPEYVDGGNNETTKAQLDLLAETALRRRGDLIFVIARLGKGERSRRLNRRRLRAVRDFLEHARAIPGRRIIAAEGEAAGGQGRVEVYLGGELFMVFILPRNKFFAREG